MHRALAFTVLLATSAGAFAQTPTVPIALSNFKFAPAAIHLKATMPATLHLQNASSGGHSFSAPEFFAAASIDPKSASLVKHGTVEVPAHGSVDVTVVPAAGRYYLKCSHTLHSTFGMKGSILVD